MTSTPQEEIGVLARRLSERGIECVIERFRLPARPRPTPPAGFFAGSAAGFLLAAGHGAASLLLATAGGILQLLDDRGFSPLDWLGRKESRSVLVVPGSPTDGERKAVFVCLPLSCRLTKAGAFSGKESMRRGLHAAGFLLCIALAAASAARLLLLAPPLPLSAAAAGAALLGISALEAVRRPPGETVRNRAAEWVERLSRPTDDGLRPFLLLYSGDPEEVKYFLARHRGELVRGTGIILEHAPAAAGPPAVLTREGPVLPVRADAELLDRVRSAGAASGAPRLRETVLREKSAGLFAMARGFRAATLFREEDPHGEEPAFSEREAERWAREVLSGIASRAPGKRRGSRPDD